MPSHRAHTAQQQNAQVLRDNCYVEKLRPWLDAFPADRFLVIRSEDLQKEARRPAILREVHEFLDLEPVTHAPAELSFVGNYRRASNFTASPQLRSTLNCAATVRMFPRRASGEERSSRGNPEL